MNIKKKDLEKSQVELTVTLTWKEFEPYLAKGAEEVSKRVKVEGFRSGKVPLDVLKQKVGEMAILEEAASIAISKDFDKVMKEGIGSQQAVGQPKVSINKLAPDNDLEYKLEIAILPEITLGEYKELGVEKEEVKVEDKELEKTLEQLAEMKVQEKAVDREIKEGDKVTAKIEMFQDKVPVEGGQSQDATVLIGKDYFLPGLDKELLKAKKGETKSFSLPFPENHHQKHLAGKMVDFKVEIKEVFERDIPKLDDEFATAFQFKSLKELKDNLINNIKHEKEHKNEQKTEIAILDAVLKNVKFGDIPEVLIEHETNNMFEEMKQSIERQGGKFEDYLSSVSKTREELTADMLPEALKRVKSALLVKEIAKKEKIEITDKDIDAKVSELKEQYKGDDKVQEMIKAPHYRAYLGNLLGNQKVISQLKEWNIKK